MQRSATRSPWRNLILVGLALLVAAPMALAQTNTAQMTGVVSDSSGGVLPGATVIAIQPATGTVVERVTDGEGRFFLPELRIGEWDVTAALPGFAPQTRTEASCSRLAGR